LRLYDEFDDALFAYKVVIVNKTENGNTVIENHQPMTNEWEKENEKMKKKLEKNAINQIKYKYSSAG
jgi:hypothetical protein